MVAADVKPRAQRRAQRNAWALGLLWGAIAAAAFLLLALSVRNSAEFERLQRWILLLNIGAVAVLTVLVVRKVWRLVRDYRAHVPGSRLTARTVGIFGALVVAPLLVVYLSSLEFLNRGIDSWFTVEVRRGLNDAVVLSRAALELRMREYSGETQELARELTGAAPAAIATGLPDSVPAWYVSPSGARRAMMRRAPPNAPTGMPPPITLPKVAMSGTMPRRSLAPPRARRKPEITSSKIKTVPCRCVSSRRISRNDCRCSSRP